MSSETPKLNRLVFIKKMYEKGVVESKNYSPLSSLSILTFHTAIELFFYLATEHLDTSPSTSISFLDYFEEINKNLSSDKTLSGKASIKRLHKARGNLKHSGITISNQDVEELRFAVTNFLKENTPLIFNLKFSDISMIELVDDKEIRDKLNEVENRLIDDDFYNSLVELSILFKKIVEKPFRDIKDYARKSENNYLGESLSLLGPNFYFVDENDFRGSKRLSDFFRQTKENIESLQGIIRVLSLGINYDNYSRFKLLTPRVYRVPGEKEFKAPDLSEDKINNLDLNKEDVQFCLDFVVETYLIVRDFKNKFYDN